MSQRPILFSGPMVRALLAGTKTQTRRVVKPQPDWTEPATVWQHGYGHSGPGWYAHHEEYPEEGALHYRCPCGQSGDRLWVRETWAPHFMYEGVKPSDILIDARSCLFYAADGGITGGCVASQRAKRWRPAIHMPRAASRITLEVTDVRVERLQDISEADAIAEGIHKPIGSQFWHTDPGANILPGETPTWAYRNLWEAINGSGSWDANPWVWVVEFKRVEGGAA